MSPTRDRNISSIGVKNQAAQGLTNLKRKASQDLLQDHPDTSSSGSDVHIDLPPRKQPWTGQDKNDLAERHNEE